MSKITQTDIEETAQSTFEWWRNEFRKNPHYEQLLKLEYEIDARKTKIEQMQQEYRQNVKDKYKGRSYTMNVLSLLKVHEAELERMEELYDTHKGKEEATGRETFDNETKKQMKQNSKDVAPDKVEIYEEAYNVISEDDGKLSDYLTDEAGNSNSDLWDTIKRRTDYEEGKVRYHLDKAINEGIDSNLPKIKKKLDDGLLLDLLLDIGFTTKLIKQ